MNALIVAPVPGWGSLTAELGRAASPVAVFFRQRYPHVRLVQKRYRDKAGPIRIDSAGGHQGTLGTAFDWAVRFMLHPQPCPDLALAGIWRRSPQVAEAAAEMVVRLGISVDGDGRAGVASFPGPTAGTAVDRELVLRSCWALALLTEVHRIGSVHPHSALAGLDPARVAAEDLLAIAPGPCLDELGQLCDVAEDELLPALANRSGLWAFGPTFDGSLLMKADADFIAAGLLMELKTSLGDKRSDGTRRAGLESPTLYQMLGYALLDFTDQYGLDTVGLYSARYGHLAIWALAELLSETAGRTVDIAGERQALQAVLKGKTT